jgi:hypothetical protein
LPWVGKGFTEISNSQDTDSVVRMLYFILRRPDVQIFVLGDCHRIFFLAAEILTDFLTLGYAGSWVYRQFSALLFFLAFLFMGLSAHF